MNPRTATSTVIPRERPALLLRPPQGEDESFPAYLTRLSTANQLTGVRALAKRLKLSEGELMTMESSVLQRLLSGDRSQAAAHREQYRHTPELLPLRSYASTTTSICLLCFKEGRLHSMLWDRPLTIICAIHQVCLIDRCPDCRQPISHRRAHIYFCTCGTDWRKCPQPSKPTWLDCLYELFAPWRLKESLEPVEHIDRERRSLVVLLNFLLPLSAEKGTRNRKGRPESSMKLDLSLIGDIGNLLDEWPVNFQRRVLEIHEISRHLIWKLLLRISKLKLTKLRAAIKTALQERRHDNRVRTLAQKDPQQIGPIRSVTEIMEVTGMECATVLKAIRTGIIKCTIIHSGLPRAKRHITVSMADSRRLRALHRCSIGYQSAASHIGCPMKYLRLFVLLGELPVSQYTRHWGAWYFRVKHLNQLMSRLKAMAVPESLASNPLTPLASATPRIANGSPTPVWTEFTRAVLGGQVRLYHMAGAGTGFASLAVQTSDLPISHRGRRRLPSGD